MFKHAKSPEEAFILQELFKRHCERPAQYPLRKRTWEDLRTRQDLVNDRLQKRKYKFSNDKWIELAKDYGIPIPESKRAEAGTYVNSILAKYKKIADAQNIEFDGTIESWSEVPEEDRNIILEFYETVGIPPKTTTMNIPITKQREFAQFIGDAIADALQGSSLSPSSVIGSFGSSPPSPSSSVSGRFIVPTAVRTPVRVSGEASGVPVDVIPGSEVGSEVGAIDVTLDTSPTVHRIEDSDYEINPDFTSGEIHTDRQQYISHKELAIKNVNDTLQRLGDNIDENAIYELKQSINMTPQKFKQVRDSVETINTRINLSNYYFLTQAGLGDEVEKLVSENPTAEKIHAMDRKLLKELILTYVLERVVTPTAARRLSMS